MNKSHPVAVKDGEMLFLYSSDLVPVWKQSQGNKALKSQEFQLPIWNKPTKQAITVKTVSMTSHGIRYISCINH